MSLSMHVGVFVGAESVNWSQDQFTAAASHSKSLGADTLIVKVADGGNLWYGGYTQCHTMLSAIERTGIKVLPYMYSYGNKFGALQAELAITNTFLSWGYDFCLDMEVEWNGQTTWAHELVQGLHQPVWISTWADPALQNWSGLLPILQPKVHFFMPQVYTSYLATVWQEQFKAAGISLAQLSPTVVPDTLHVGAGLSSVSLWEYPDATTQSIQQLRTQGAFMLTLQQVGSYYEAVSATQWKCKQTGQLLGGGLLSYYCRVGSGPFYGLTLYGLPKTGEIAVPGHTGVVIQVFERAILCWDEKGVIDKVPGADSAYALHLDNQLALAQLAKYLPPIASPTKVDLSPIVTSVKQLQATLDTNFANVLSQLEKV